MIVTMEIPAESRATVAASQMRADHAAAAMQAALQTSVVVGADVIRQALNAGQLGLASRHPGQAGLADSVMGWMIDPDSYLAALGVPANSPAAPYALAQEEGRHITPKNAGALAIPVSDEARQYSSPRDMAGLTLIKRKGRPSLLVRQGVERTPTGRAAHGAKTAWEVMWVLVMSVDLPATRWFTHGVELAKAGMQAAFDDRLNEGLNAR